jgi:hypothetical protein
LTSKLLTSGVRRHLTSERGTFTARTIAPTFTVIFWEGAMPPCTTHTCSRRLRARFTLPAYASLQARANTSIDNYAAVVCRGWHEASLPARRLTLLTSIEQLLANTRFPTRRRYSPQYWMRHSTKGLLANRHRRDAFNYEPASRRKPPHISSYILTVLTIDTVHFDAPALRLALVF